MHVLRAPTEASSAVNLCHKMIVLGAACKPLLCLQVLAQPVYMEDHLGVLEEEVSAGLVPLPQLPKHKQVNLGPQGSGCWYSLHGEFWITGCGLMPGKHQASSITSRKGFRCGQQLLDVAHAHNALHGPMYGEGELRQHPALHSLISRISRLFGVASSHALASTWRVNVCCETAGFLSFLCGCACRLCLTSAYLRIPAGQVAAAYTPPRTAITTTTYSSQQAAPHMYTTRRLQQQQASLGTPTSQLMVLLRGMTLGRALLVSTRRSKGFTHPCRHCRVCSRRAVQLRQVWQHWEVARMGSSSTSST